MVDHPLPDESELTAAQESGVGADAAILAANVAWESLASAGMLTDAEVQAIRRFDKRDRFTQAALWEKEGASYAAVFVTVLRNVSKDETTKYVLALLDEALIVEPERIRSFHGSHMGALGPYAIPLRLLERNDWFIQDRASKLLGKLLASRADRNRPLGLDGVTGVDAPAPEPGSAAATCLSFLDWAIRTLRSPSDARLVSSATGALACLMAERELRPIAWRHGALGLLAPCLRAASAGPHNVQLLYEAGLAVWLLTFYPPAAEGTLASGALAGLLETARSASKEKVVRVALAALRNLLEAEASPGARAAVLATAGRLAATLRLKAFHDEEVLDAISALEESAAAGAKAAGSFERYRQEVLSGALEWGGGRGDEAFWREHTAQFEENNFALVRTLCAVLSNSSTPPRALAVACHDLGQIAANVPRGRVIVTECGGKSTALKLMSHADEEVQKQALLATQKMLLQGWAFLQ